MTSIWPCRVCFPPSSVSACCCLCLDSALVCAVDTIQLYIPFFFSPLFFSVYSDSQRQASKQAALLSAPSSSSLCSTLKPKWNDQAQRKKERMEEGKKKHNNKTYPRGERKKTTTTTNDFTSSSSPTFRVLKLDTVDRTPIDSVGVVVVGPPQTERNNQRKGGGGNRSSKL